MIVSGLVVLLASTLVACTLSAGAGTIGGIIGTLLLVGALIVGVGGTQSGCDDSRTVKTDVGPCLSLVNPDVGPCLGMPMPDVGPCLSVDAPPGDFTNDVRVGPCLDPLPPDAGVEQGVRDQGREIPIGPCLSLPPGDASSRLDPAPSGAREGAHEGERAAPAGERERRAVVDKLAANLPADVVARLRGEQS